MEWLSSPEAWASFLTLVVMEIILGIDNIIFISILTGKLPAHQQKRGRILGIAFALVIRVILLFSLTWVMTLTAPLFNIGQWFNLTGEWADKLAISGRDLILILGGLFLLYKSVHEIYGSLEGEHNQKIIKPLSFTATIIQIGILDLVFGLDSVITAIGMADHIEIMIAAVIISMIFMVVAVNPVGNFVNRHPSVKILALSFLILIGVSLLAEGVDMPIAKSNIYFAMGFSMFVQFLILRQGRKKDKGGDPVQLKKMINE